MNYGEILDAVKDYLWRGQPGDTSLSEDVVHAHVQSAMRKLQSVRRWWWLESIRTSMSVTAGRVAIPAQMKSITALSRVDGDVDRVPLDETHVVTLRARWDSDDTGDPVEYALHQGEIFLAPAPTDARPAELEIVYQGYLLPLTTSDTDKAKTNALLTDHPLAVIYSAAAALASGYLQDPQMADRYAALASVEVASMEEEDDERKASLYGGNVVPDLYLYQRAHGDY